MSIRANNLPKLISKIRRSFPDGQPLLFVRTVSSTSETTSIESAFLARVQTTLAGACRADRQGPNPLFISHNGKWATPPPDRVRTPRSAPPDRAFAAAPPPPHPGGQGP